MKRFWYFFILFVIWLTFNKVIAVILVTLGIYVFLSTPTIAFGLTMLLRPCVYRFIYNEAGLFEGFAGKPAAFLILGLGTLLLNFDTAMAITNGFFIR